MRERKAEEMEGSTLTNEQMRLFGNMMYKAFLEIRSLSWTGFPEQAGTLADAFHNLPFFLFSPDFDWKVARMHIGGYQQKYPTFMKDDIKRSYDDYLGMFDEIEKLKR